jgi:hypothetical protein
MTSLPTTKINVVKLYRQGLTQAARFVRLGAWALLASWATNVAALHGTGKGLSLAAIVGALEVAFRQVIPAVDEKSIAAQVLKSASELLEPKKSAPPAAPKS